jgi:hypothetical protein
MTTCEMSYFEVGYKRRLVRYATSTYYSLGLAYEKRAQEYSGSTPPAWWSFVCCLQVGSGVLSPVVWIVTVEHKKWATTCA